MADDRPEPFLKAGVLSEDQVLRRTDTGTPQGGILSPLLANISLEVLDEHFSRATRVDRSRRRRHDQPVYRLVRYADDFVVLVSGTREHAEAMREQTADVLAPLGLRLSQEKTSVVHIDDGFDFLGFRIQHRKPGTSKSYVYTLPARKSVASVRRKVKTITQQGTNQPLSDLLRQLNMLLRGWTRYFQHGMSKRAFGYLRHYTWTRVVGWLRKKHRKTNWQALRRRYSTQGWWPHQAGVELFDPCSGDGHPLPLPQKHRDTVGRASISLTIGTPSWRAGRGESRTSGSGGGPGETDRSKHRHRAPGRPHLGTQVLDEVRRRVQEHTIGHRGHKHDPLYRIRGLLRHGAERLTDRQVARLETPAWSPVTPAGRSPSPGGATSSCLRSTTPGHQPRVGGSLSR